MSLARPHRGAILVTGVLIGIGIYDIAVGVLMLSSSTPWMAHGPGTSWIALGETLRSAPAGDPVMGLFRRMGAFSLHAGVCTIVWASLGHRRPWLQTALFLTYLSTGIAFAVTDAAYFAGTPYLAVKRV